MVYKSQYQSRLQRLEPKLEMLATAREKDKEGPIPIISSSCRFLKKTISSRSNQEINVYLKIYRII